MYGIYFHTSKERMTKHYFDKNGCEIKEWEVVNDMKLENTVELMTSNDYKDRFLAEYYQVKIRYEKLLNTIKRYENKTLEFELSCDINLLRKQAFVMECYMDILKERANVECVEL